MEVGRSYRQGSNMENEHCGRQKFEQNVKDYLEAMDKIQHNLVKILEESMKLNETLQEAISVL